MKNVDIISLKLTMSIVFIYIDCVLKILDLNFMKIIRFQFGSNQNSSLSLIISLS